jgi:ribosomal protein S12 methylthiotransferase accessory factor
MLEACARECVGKTYRRGTHRSMSPAETVARMQPLLSSFGVTRIANLTGLDRIGVPVVMVCRPNARSSAVFHGKGIDLDAAKASGIMEAVETWHAEHMQMPLRLASLTDLRQTCEVADAHGLPRVPNSRFHDDLPILWVEGRDLIGQVKRWAPYETVHMNATLPEPSGSGCFAASTNGLASGNIWLEATSHALCECIERDATTLWRRRQPAAQDAMRLALSTVGDEACRILLDRFERADFDVAVWDVTTDVGVSAFQCFLLDRSGEIGHVGQGAGCHPVSDIALLRALAEAAQVRMTYVAGSREDIRHADYQRAVLERRHRSVRALMRAVGKARDFSATPSFPFDDFAAEVAWICDRLAAAGMQQAIAVDLTRPEYGVAVVRVVVPGLEGADHDTSSFVPGARARALQRDG